MTPEIGLLIIQAAIKWGPPIAIKLAKIFEAKTHTLAEWLDVLNDIQSYEQMDAASKLRVGLAS